jgi:hypothetical protein
MTWLPSDILRAWVNVGVGGCECGCGYGWVSVGVGEGWNLELDASRPLRTVAVGTYVTWLPCQLVAMSLGNEVIN